MDNADLVAAKTQLVDATYILRENAVPNYRDFLNDQVSPRLAFNAAISIAHMVDHIVLRGGGKRGEVGNLAKDFANTSPPFRYAQATRHVIKPAVADR